MSRESELTQTESQRVRKANILRCLIRFWSQLSVLVANFLLCPWHRRAEPSQQIGTSSGSQTIALDTASSGWVHFEHCAMIKKHPYLSPCM